MPHPEIDRRLPGRPIRSPATQAAYEKRVHQLLRRCVREVARPNGETRIGWTTFVTWLIAQKSSWVAPTWRLNKAAVVHVLDRAVAAKAAPLPTEADGAATARIRIGLDVMRAALSRIEGETSAGCAADTRKTSSCKLKRFPEADRRAIEDALVGMRTRYAADLTAYLLAGVRTGLRPGEWQNAVIVPSPDPNLLILEVRNAKSDAVRSHGPTRRLTFSNPTESDRRAIRFWLSRVGEAGDAFDALMTALGDLLYAVTRRLWRRRTRQVTLYSVRHEFAALCKLRFEPAEVGALMGHATDVTATDHYGRYRARGGLPPALQGLVDRLPIPCPDEVRRVRRKLDAKLARLPDLRERSGIAQARSRR